MFNNNHPPKWHPQPPSLPQKRGFVPNREWIFDRRKKAGKTPELYNELEKLEDFFRQEAVFMAKAWIEVFMGWLLMAFGHDVLTFGKAKRMIKRVCVSRILVLIEKTLLIR